MSDDTLKDLKELDEIKNIDEQVRWILRNPFKTLNIIYYLIEIIKDIELETGEELLKK